jgi:hypothetical protein
MLSMPAGGSGPNRLVLLDRTIDMAVIVQVHDSYMGSLEERGE